MDDTRDVAAHPRLHAEQRTLSKQRPCLACPAVEGALAGHRRGGVVVVADELGDPLLDARDIRTDGHRDRRAGFRGRQIERHALDSRRDRIPGRRDRESFDLDLGVSGRREHRHRRRLSLALTRVVFQFLERTVRRRDLHVDRLGAARCGSSEDHPRAIVGVHDAGTHPAIVRCGIDRIAKLRERHPIGRRDDEFLAVLRECQLAGPDQRAAAPGVRLGDQFMRRRERQHFDRVGADGRAGRGRCPKDRHVGRYGTPGQNLAFVP